MIGPSLSHSRPLVPPLEDGSEEAAFPFAIENVRLAIPEGFSAGMCYQLGRCFDEEGKREEAFVFFLKAIEKDPSLAAAYNDLGGLYQKEGRLQQAVHYYQKALSLAPDFTEAHYNLANAYKEMGKWPEAVSEARQATALAPGLQDAWYVLGIALYEQERLAEAVQAWEEALRLDPQSAVLPFNLGIACYRSNRLEEARRYLELAVERNPDNPEAHYNQGLVDYALEETDAAIRCWQRALSLDPNHLDALNNLGAVFQELQELPRALRCFNTALDLQPDFADARWNRAVCLLLAGDYERGWEEYEWRIQVGRHNLKREFDRPQWKGEPVQGKRILLYSEQGFGDTFQFARYVPLVLGSGGRVILECYPELASLLAGSFPGLEAVIIRSQPLPEFDFYCPLPSLPLIFQTRLETIPLDIPYLFPDPSLVGKWKEKLEEDRKKLRVGLVWCGRTENQKQRKRPVPFACLTSLLTIPGVRFYSLQKGEAARQLQETVEGRDVIDLSPELKDFSETAACLMNLDLIISIDTAVAHLAGALGRAVWTLIPYSPDWRWLLDREDSPWYPTMRLFRQPAPGDWNSVIEKVRGSLSDLVLEKTKRTIPLKTAVLHKERVTGWV